MNLITSKEAANTVFVTVGMISYWIRKGYLQKHYTGSSTYNYLVDLDEVLSIVQTSKDRLKSKHEGLISPKHAAEILWVGVAEIRYYVRKGYLKKHYVLGNNYNYLVEESEVRKQPLLIGQRVDSRIPKLKEHASNQRRDRRGWFLTTKE